MKKYVLIILAFFSVTCYSQIELSTEEKVYNVVEQMPEFPGGPAKMTKFIKKNLNFPESAIKNNTYGKCFARFIINADGSIGEISILKGVPDCPDCNQEVSRLISTMPKWTPAKQDGKNVAVYFNLPINFAKK